MSPGCLAMSVWCVCHYGVRVDSCVYAVILRFRLSRTRSGVCIYEYVYAVGDTQKLCRYGEGVRIGIRTRCVYTTGVYKKVIQN